MKTFDYLFGKLFEMIDVIWFQALLIEILVLSLAKKHGRFLLFGALLARTIAIYATKNSTNHVHHRSSESACNLLGLPSKYKSSVGEARLCVLDL